MSRVTHSTVIAIQYWIYHKFFGRVWARAQTHTHIHTNKHARTTNIPNWFNCLRCIIVANLITRSLFAAKIKLNGFYESIKNPQHKHISSTSSISYDVHRMFRELVCVRVSVFCFVCCLLKLKISIGSFGWWNINIIIAKRVWFSPNKINDLSFVNKNEIRSVTANTHPNDGSRSPVMPWKVLLFSRF